MAENNMSAETEVSAPSSESQTVEEIRPELLTTTEEGSELTETPAAGASDIAIKVSHVTMQFDLMEQKCDTLKEYIVRMFKGQLSYNAFTALNNVSVQIRKGDIVGFVGFNGAGKSTLLKIIAGVLSPTKGRVQVNGSVAPLIEVGAGFDPELTARENIFLNGAILGHSRQFLLDRFDKIIDFAELHQFVDVPVKNFSSGMYSRLGFSIATEVNPDILLVDEVLSVGDQKFQKKCEERIQGIIEKGTTIVIVSHSLGTIEKLCSKVLWLDHGVVKEYGDAKTVCKHYSEA